MKPTSTPWQKECSLFRETDISVGIFTRDGEKIAVWNGLTRAEAGKVHANVDRIILAVNTHRQLLEALKDLTALYAASPGRSPIFVSKGQNAIASGEGK